MTYFVTGNDKKWAEIEAILGESIPLKRSNIDLPEWQGSSLEEIATKKAISAFNHLSSPVIIEDTALCFKSLGGLPGAYVKWFLESTGTEGMTRMLDGFGEEGRFAEAVCTMAYHDGIDKVTLFQGKTKGRIALHPQGPNTFGWDPIFIPTDHYEQNQLSYAEMDKTLKNKISHRAKALEALQNYFK